jgi:hypothetical protein
MKLNVSKRAEKPADNYLKSQMGLCFLWTVCAILMCIFGLLMHQKIKDTMTTLTAAGKVETIPKQYGNAQGYSDKVWIQGLTQLAAACCCGTGLVFLAKYLLDSGNAGCMKFCCVFDGVCGTLGCFEGVGLLISFIWMCVIYSAMGDATKLCSTVLPTTPAPLPAGVTGANIPDCSTFITGIRPAIGMFACLLCCMCTLSFKIAGLLCFGAKNAKEVADVFDDEEYGYDEQDAGLYDNEAY